MGVLIPDQWSHTILMFTWTLQYIWHTNQCNIWWTDYFDIQWHKKPVLLLFRCYDKHFFLSAYISYCRGMPDSGQWSASGAVMRSSGKEKQTDNWHLIFFTLIRLRNNSSKNNNWLLTLKSWTMLSLFLKYTRWRNMGADLKSAGLQNKTKLDRIWGLYWVAIFENCNLVSPIMG